MTEDEFQGKVLRQLAAIVARLDEQDHQFDRLAGKVDRLSVLVSSSLEASEMALSSITDLRRRIVRLEHPEGGN